MSSYCVEVEDHRGVFEARVTDGSGATAVATSRVSAYDAAAAALASLMPEPDEAP